MATLSPNLSYSHYVELLPINNIEEVKYYIKICEELNLGMHNLKKLSQDKTIGIIICKKDNKYVIEYCSDDRIIAREYEFV